MHTYTFIICLFILSYLSLAKNEVNVSNNVHSLFYLGICLSNGTDLWTYVGGFGGNKVNRKKCKSKKHQNFTRESTVLENQVKMAASAAMMHSSLTKRLRNFDTTVGAYSEHLSNSEMAKWTRIYPVYLNKQRTKKRGRRVASDKAIDNPTATEIRDVLQHAGFKTHVETWRSHPRELSSCMIVNGKLVEQPIAGRVLVQIFDDENRPISDRVKNKSELLDFLCEMIPKLKSRVSKSTPSTSSAGQETSRKKRWYIDSDDLFLPRVCIYCACCWMSVVRSGHWELVSTWMNIVFITSIELYSSNKLCLKLCL